MERPCNCNEVWCKPCWLANHDIRYKTLWTPPAPTVFNLATVPERTYLVNLRKRPDRLTKALAECNKAGIAPIIETAFDGSAYPTPIHWPAGAGAYGCYRSHLAVLEKAIDAGVSSLLVLEDDVVFVDDFQQKLRDLLGRLPADADCVFLGGQHMGTPTEVAPGLLAPPRGDGIHRTHAYILLNKAYIRRLHSLWAGSSGHVDHIWGQYQHEAKVFAPDRWLALQGEGHSDINGREHAQRSWNPKTVMRTGKAPVVPEVPQVPAAPVRGTPDAPLNKGPRRVNINQLTPEQRRQVGGCRSCGKKKANGGQ